MIHRMGGGRHFRNEAAHSFYYSPRLIARWMARVAYMETWKEYSFPGNMK
jgi:hypothetical protein